MSEVNNSIKCTIESCKHHNNLNYCKLEEICVGGKCHSNHCKDTECVSFCSK